MLSNDAAVALAADLKRRREGERHRLEKLLSYRQYGTAPYGLVGNTTLSGIPMGAPREVRVLAEISRVNLMRYVVASRVQSMYVEGYQTDTAPDNVPAWNVWQANALDARQVGVHRSALTFGSSYVVVLPGKPAPVIRGVSPRNMTVAYGYDDDVWPVAALWYKGGKNYRLIDATHVYELLKTTKGMLVREVKAHDLGVCPVVRFRDTCDLDVDVEGVVEPMIQLQDQINVTSFGLHVAQHYGAFRQRYILGWLAETESEALKTGASRFMTFEDGPGDIQIGEFSQTELRGYIESREASIRHLATVSQTPVHELMGQFVNLSAEALEAAKASHHAGVEENRIAAGEAWEQVLGLASRITGDAVEDGAAVVWRDTTMRSLKEAAEALGLLATNLGIPAKALWSRIPGASQHEIEQWKAAADEPGALDDLVKTLERQAAPAAPAPTPTSLPPEPPQRTRPV